MAVRLIEAIIVDKVSLEGKIFIEEQNIFFFASVDQGGPPGCSYKAASKIAYSCFSLPSDI